MSGIGRTESSENLLTLAKVKEVSPGRDEGKAGSRQRIPLALCSQQTALSTPVNIHYNNSIPQLPQL